MLSYQPNPSAPTIDEQFPREWELKNKARNVVARVLTEYFKAMRDNGFKPDYTEELLEVLAQEMDEETGFSNRWAKAELGEGYIFTDEEIQEALEKVDAR